MINFPRAREYNAWRMLVLHSHLRGQISYTYSIIRNTSMPFYKPSLCQVPVIPKGQILSTKWVPNPAGKTDKQMLRWSPTEWRPRLHCAQFRCWMPGIPWHLGNTEIPAVYHVRGSRVGLAYQKLSALTAVNLEICRPELQTMDSPLRADTRGVLLKIVQHACTVFIEPALSYIRMPGYIHMWVNLCHKTEYSF